MDVEDAVRAVEFIKPQKVVPMHYGTFPLIESSPEAFKDQVTNAEVIILKPNETLDF